MKLACTCFIGVLVLLWSVSVSPQWIENGVPVCVESGSQEQPRIVSDGSDGAFIVWVDSRDGDRDIYAQRISGEGTVLWLPGGIAVCTADLDQRYPTAIPDGSGGVIVTWQDFRSGAGYDRYNYNIYAQKIDGNGSIKWTDDGLPVCTMKGNQQRPVIASDGEGGAIITWLDGRSGARGVYAQRINTNGMPLWQSNGADVCAGVWTLLGFEWPDIASDGAGGAIITWQDYRNGTDHDIYAQRILQNGLRMWTKNGISVCSAALNQYDPHIVPDGSGGAVIAWTSGELGSRDIFAQRISASGSMIWPANGVPVCTAYGNQQSARLASDGAGGAIIAWQGPGTNAQRITADGAQQWPANGVPVLMISLGQFGIQVISDGSGGVIFGGYKQYSHDTTKVYAQKIDMNGLYPWASEGVPVCVERALREDVRLVSDGLGGAIFAWEDFRDGEGDIYAMRVYDEAPPVEVYFDIRPASCPNPLNPKSRGVLPTAVVGTAEFDVSAIDLSSVKLEGLSPIRWNVVDVTAPTSGVEGCACTEEASDGIDDLLLKFQVPRLVENLGELTPGEIVTLTVTGSLIDGTEFEGSDCAIVVGGEKPDKDGRPRKMLAAAVESRPDDVIQRVSYYLPELSVVEIAVFDVLGRRVKNFPRVSRPEGIHTVEWDTSGLSSGVYFCRLKTGRRAESIKLVLLR